MDPMDPGLLGALGALLSGMDGDGGSGGLPGGLAGLMGGSAGGGASIAILTVPGRGIVGTAITPNGLNAVRLVMGNDWVDPTWSDSGRLDRNHHHQPTPTASASSSSRNSSIDKRLICSNDMDDFLNSCH